MANSSSAREKLVTSALIAESPAVRALFNNMNETLGNSRVVFADASSRAELAKLGNTMLQDPKEEPMGNVFLVSDMLCSSACGDDGRLGMLDPANMRAGSGVSPLSLSSQAAAVLAGGLPTARENLKPWLRQPEVAPFAAVVGQVMRGSGGRMDYAAYKKTARGAKLQRALRDNLEDATGMSPEEMYAASKEGGARGAAALARITAVHARFDESDVSAIVLAKSVLASAPVAPLLELRDALSECAPLPMRAALAAFAVGWAFQVLGDLEQEAVSAMLVMLGGGAPLREGEFQHAETERASSAFAAMAEHPWATMFKQFLETEEPPKFTGFTRLPAPRVVAITDALCAAIDVQIEAGGSAPKAAGTFKALAGVLLALQASAPKELSATLRMPAFGSQAALALAWFCVPSAADLLSSRAILPDNGRLLSVATISRKAARCQSQLLLDAQCACVFDKCFKDAKGSKLEELRALFDNEFPDASRPSRHRSARARWLKEAKLRASRRAFVQGFAAPLADVPSAGLIQRANIIFEQYGSTTFAEEDASEEGFVQLLAARAEEFPVMKLDDDDEDGDGASVLSTSSVPAMPATRKEPYAVTIVKKTADGGQTVSRMFQGDAFESFNGKTYTVGTDEFEEMLSAIGDGDDIRAFLEETFPAAASEETAEVREGNV